MVTGKVVGTLGPMEEMAVPLAASGAALGDMAAVSLASTGNASLDEALSALDSQFRGALVNLGRGNATEGQVVIAVAANFAKADGA